MVEELIRMAKSSEVKIDPASYHGEVNLIGGLTRENLFYLKGVIDGAHPEEKVIFKYNGRHFSIGELIEIKNLKGRLEFKVTADKDKDWLDQKRNNEYANLCFNALLEFFGKKAEK